MLFLDHGKGLATIQQRSAKPFLSKKKSSCDVYYHLAPFNFFNPSDRGVNSTCTSRGLVKSSYILLFIIKHAPTHFTPCGTPFLCFGVQAMTEIITFFLGEFLTIRFFHSFVMCTHLFVGNRDDMWPTNRICLVYHRDVLHHETGRLYIQLQSAHLSRPGGETYG